MKIQEWLRNNNGDLELLEEQFGISATRHEDGRVILNYSQIDSPVPKDHHIVVECRGLVLDSKHNWNLVARAFTRFFNVGECSERFNNFVWHNSWGYHKEDGSLLLVYYWYGEWRFNTRASFCEGECCNDMTWKDLALKAIPQTFFDNAIKGFTYVFELCSPYNKIVRQYSKPQVFLLSMFDIKGNELAVEDVESHAKYCNVEMPFISPFFSIEEVQNYITVKSHYDKTFEGIVLRDKNNERWKVKSPEYLALHRMANNGDPCHYKNILPFIISGELDELYAYFEEVKPYVEWMQEIIDKEWKDIDGYWYCFHDEPSQKKFALAVVKCRHSGILFAARKLKVEPHELYYNLEYLTKMFKNYQHWRK